MWAASLDAMNGCDPLTAELLAQGPYVRTDAPYRLLTLSGPDAGDFLQRLCSQDVRALADGEAKPAAFLDSKGKVVVTCLVQRVGEGAAATYWLETQGSQHDALAQLLDRYHFTEKLAIGKALAEPVCDEWIGTASVSPPPRTAAVHFAWTRGGVQFVRRHAEHGASLPAWSGTPMAEDLAAALRTGAGIVAVGVDTEPTTLALEAFLDDHCSTTKGCYTGQEVVARIHTYGHTNRALCLLDLDDGPRFAQPVVLHEPEDDLPVGRVMAAFPVPGRSRRRGLGYLPKDFQKVGQRLRVASGGEAVVAAVFAAS